MDARHLHIDAVHLICLKATDPYFSLDRFLNFTVVQQVPNARPWTAPVMVADRSITLPSSLKDT